MDWAALAPDARPQPGTDPPRAALRLSAPLGSPVDGGESADRYAQIVRIAQHVFDVKMAAVNLLDEETLTSLAVVGLPPYELPRQGTLCDRTVRSDSTFVVPDARLDPRFASQPFVTGDPHVRFYAGAPVTGPNGQRVGALCVFDDEPRGITDHETRLLRDLADWVEQELVHDSDRTQAREVQRRLLPAHAIVVPGYDIAGHSVPARNVGGDFYDWQPLPGGAVQLVVADVMGKGMTAAVVAAGARALMRAASRFIGLSEAVTRTAQDMDDDFSHTGSFVTMFAARLDPGTGSLDYVDAGHGLALVIKVTGDVLRLESRDLPIGAVTGDSWQMHRAHLEPGDTLLVVSDGILDLFPDVSAAIRAGVALSAHVRDADEMAGRIAGIGGGIPLDDDITALVVRRDPT